MVKLVTMVTKAKATKAKDSIVVLEAHLTSLGKSRNRWCILIPPKVTRYLGKQTRYEVSLKPMGTIPPIRILEAVS